MQLASNVPGQEFLNAIDGMIGDIGQHVAQIGLRINAVQPGAADERVHGRSALATVLSQ